MDAMKGYSPMRRWLRLFCGRDEAPILPGLRDNPAGRDMSDEGWPACERRCGACLDCYHHEADVLRSRVARMASMLRRLETMGNFNDPGERRCPVCGCFPDDAPHSPTCDLATLLREIP